MLKNCQHPENPLEKCASKVSLCDPAEVQRNQKAPGDARSTHRSHKYMSNNCNPELFRAETHPKINYTPLLLLNSPTVCPEVSLSDMLFRLLRSNSSVVQLKISRRPSAVDTSDPLFNTWKPQMQLERYTPV